MTVSRSAAARAHVRVFEDVTGVTPTDCVVDDRFDRVIFLVPPAEMSRVVGSGGATVERLEDRIDSSIDLIEDAPTAAELVSNALSPATVTNVTVSENGDRVAYVEVAHDELDVAIGADGRNVRAAKCLADRHFGVDDIQFT